MLICGIPMFFLEVSVGQYLGVGGMSVVGQLAPIFKVIVNIQLIFINFVLFSLTGCRLFCDNDGVPRECLLHHRHHLDPLLPLQHLHGPPQAALE